MWSFGDVGRDDGFWLGFFFFHLYFQLLCSYQRVFWGVPLSLNLAKCKSAQREKSSCDPSFPRRQPLNVYLRYLEILNGSSVGGGKDLVLVFPPFQLEIRVMDRLIVPRTQTDFVFGPQTHPQIDNLLPLDFVR